MTMLFIIDERDVSVSFHDNETAALAALVCYVDDHWVDVALPELALRLDATERIDVWFRETGALYIIGEVSMEVAC